MVYTLEPKITFLFEKWNESYQKYYEVNIAKEKVILGQEAIWCFWQSQKAESAGV